jgi:hypothetical protein
LFCLLIWLGLELLCFGILPLLTIIQFESSSQWFALSVALGILGILCFVASSYITLTTSDRQKRSHRSLQWLTGRAMAWLGLAGIAFPLFVISERIVSGIFDRLLA